MQNEIYKRIGVPLQLWIKQKYGSQRECCRLLQIKQSFLSMIINGSRKANRDIILKLKEAGFDVSLFHYYLSVSPLPKSERLTIQEVEFLVRGLKDLVGQKDIVIEALQYEIKNYRNDISYLREKIHKLKKLVNSQKSELLIT